MTKREYLKSLGFTVGERGRFTDAMKRAIEEYTGKFDEPISSSSNYVGPEGKPWYPASDTPVRPKYAFEGRTKEGYTIRWDGCYRCKSHMIYCVCPNGVYAPPYIATCNDPLVVVGGV